VILIGQDKEYEDKGKYAKQDEFSTVKPIFSTCVLMDVNNPPGRDNEKAYELELIP
jgi:hypothetical protein